MTPICTTERLILRACVPKDATSLTARLNNRQIAISLGRLPHPYRLHHAQDWIAACEDDPLPNWVMIEQAGDRTLVGGIGLNNYHHGRLELGYWIAKDAWGLGYASEAVEAVLNYCFGDIGLTEIWAGYFYDNPRSARVLERMGFRPDGEEPTYCVARGCDVRTFLMHLDATSWARLRGRQS